MKNSAVSILSVFSKEEIKSFSLFLLSPFHNNNNKVILLFDILKKYHPDYDDPRLTSENLFREMFGKEKHRESYIRNLFSDLKILAESFLVHISIARNPVRSKLLIEEFHDRNLTGLLNKKIEEFEKKVRKSKLKDQDYFLNMLFTYDVKSFINVDMTLTDSFRKDQISSLVNFFFLSIMESFFHLSVEEQRINIKHDFTFLKYILNYIKDNEDKFSDVPLLLIYYHLWLGFMEADNEKDFLKAKEIFKLHFDTLTQIDKKNIYSIVQIYYDKKISEGDLSYYTELLNLLLEMLKHNVISHNRKNSINMNLYRNVLILCFKLNEKEKLSDFVKEYLKFVRSESRNSISAYSSAHLNFLEGNTEEALVQCHKVDFNNLLTTTNENLYFKLDVKTLMLKCLYDLNSFESALAHLQTLRQFLNNSKIIKESSKEKYIVFAKAVNELISLNFKYDEFKLVSLKKLISKYKETPGAEWLEKKIQDLSKRNQALLLITN